MFNVSKSTYSSNRTLAFEGLPDPVVHGDADGVQLGGDLSGGYDFYLGEHWAVGPFVGLQYVHFDLNDFNEVGPVPTGLIIGDEMNSLRSRIGGKFDYRHAFQRVALDFQGRAAWQHEYLNDGHNLTGGFFGGGGPTFVVPTTIHGRNSALAGVGANVTVWNLLTFFANYDVQAGQSDYLVQSANGGLRIDF
jgi:outer membrane autotransporter protein